MADNGTAKQKKQVRELFNAQQGAIYDKYLNGDFVLKNEQLFGLDTKYPKGTLSLISDMMVTGKDCDNWIVAAKALDRITHKHGVLALPTIVDILEREKSVVLLDLVSPQLSYLYKSFKHETIEFFRNSMDQADESKNNVLQSLLNRYCYDEVDVKLNM